MSTIKTQFVTLHTLLLDNAGKKLTPKLMTQLEELMTSKVMAKTFKKDDEGNVTHIFCYYHKEWEEVAVVPYGNKASTAHGFNTMCKEGVSHWTKQQRVLKAEKSKLLDRVSNGEVEASDLPSLLEEIESQAKTIIARVELTTKGKAYVERIQSHDEQVAELEQQEIDELAQDC